MNNSAYDYINTGVKLMLEHPEYYHNYHLWIYEWDKSQPWKLAGQSGVPMQRLLIAVPDPEQPDTGTVKLTVKKLEAGTNKPLPGVTFTIKNAEDPSKFSVTKDTGADGTITLTAEADRLTAGQYLITEDAVPEGYVAQTASQLVTVLPGGGANSEFTFYNEPDEPGGGDGSIRKVDSDNPTVGIAGAVIRITSVKLDDGGSFFGEYTTGDGGYIPKDKLDFSKLPTGAYLAEEITPPEGYILSSDVSKVKQPFVWDGKTDVSLVFENSSKVKVQLKKVDESNQPLPGAIFVVLRDGQVISTEETQEDGTITVSNVAEGYYEFREASAPAGFDCDRSPVGVHVEAKDLQGEQTIVVTKMNHHKRSLTIQKRDAESGDPIPGTSFHVRGVNLGYENDVVTGVDGKAVLEAMPSGCYEIEEVDVPKPYILDSNNRKTVWIDAEKDKDVVVDFVNSKLPGVRLLKLDRQTNKPIPNATFKIEEVDGGFTDQRQTDKDGMIFWENLRPGAYKVYEVEPAPNYVHDDTVHVVQLEPDHTTTIELTNILKPTLKVLKVDSVTHSPIANVKFQIWRGSDDTISGELNDLGVFQTNASGEIVLEHIDTGWYRIRELESAPGFTIKAPDTQDIYLKAGETHTVQFENVPKNAIAVEKYDSVTHQALPGCTFQLRYLDGASGTGGTVIGQKVTGKNGMAMWTGLNPGTYIIEEVDPADGYHIVKASETVYLADSGEQSVVTVRFNNSPDGSLLIRKVCATNPSVTLQNAEFKVTYSDGTLIGDSNGIFRSDENGEVRIDGLTPGKSVIVTEVRAPAGFLLDTQSQTIQVKEGRTVSVTMKNQPMGKLVIQKRDSQTNEVLPGAQFRVTTAAGCEVGLDGVIGTSSLTSNGIFTTDSQGEIRISNLAPGAYVINEIKAPDGGYVIDTPSTNVVIGQGGDTQTVVITNTKKGGLIVEKYDKITRQPLSGAQFKVMNANGELTPDNEGLTSSNGLYTTDQNGQIVLSKLLPGTYVVSEEKAPDNYRKDPTPQTVVVNAGDTQTVRFYDDPLCTLTILKRDSVTKKPLKGAEFLVRDSSGHVIGPNNGLYTTGTDGTVTVTGLAPNSTVVVSEKRAPTGYILDETPKNIVVRSGVANGLIFDNEPGTTLIIRKFIEGTENEPLSGVCFRVVDGSGAAVGPDDGRYYTDKAGEIVLEGIEPGTTVKVREIKTVEGFVLDGTPQDILIKGGEVQQLTFWNKRAGTLVIEKKDSLTGALISGAQFHLTYANGGYVDTDAMKRRIISIITALALCLSLCPTWALAEEADPSLCKHHPEHTEDCGYTAPTEGHDCGHEHTAACYTLGVLPDADGGDPYEIGGDTENLLDCHHSHDSACGYVQADPGTPCGYGCRICPVEELIAALPEKVTEENRADVEARLQEILALLEELPEEQQDLVDITPCLALQEQLDAAGAASPLAEGDGTAEHPWLCGAEGNNLTAVLSDDKVTLTISGTGAMADYFGNGAPWQTAYNTITKVELPEGLTTIGDFAFSNMAALRQITIPNTVTSIGNSAFLACNMNKVSIPEGVKTIGSYAFDNSSLESVVLPASVTQVGAYAFNSCKQLQTLTVQGETKLMMRAFNGCSKLNTITFSSKTPPSIFTEVFSGCSALATIKVPHGCEAAYQTALANSGISNLESIITAPEKHEWNDDGSCACGAQAVAVRSIFGNTTTTTFLENAEQLSDAFTQDAEGDVEVFLLKAVELSQPITIRGSGFGQFRLTGANWPITYIGNGAAIQIAGGNVTLSTCKIDGKQCCVAVSGGEVDISDSTFNAAGNEYEGGQGVYINGGNVTIATSTCSGMGGDSAAGVEIQGGAVTIAGGTFSGAGGVNAAGVKVGQNGKVTIQDGSFSGTDGYDASGLRVFGEADISGGVFTGSYYGVYNAGNTTISGGTFSSESHPLDTNGSFAEMLATGCAYYRDNKPIKVDNGLSPGTVTVRKCGHPGAEVADNGDGTHSVDCPYCGGSYSHDTVLKAEADPATNTVTLTGGCNTEGCGYSKELGTVSFTFENLVYGNPNAKVTFTNIPVDYILICQSFQRDDGITEASWTLAELFGSTKVAAGKHKMEVSFANAANIYSNVCELDFTIDPAPLTASITGTATKPYDGTTDVASDQLSITLTGVVGGDTVTATATGYAYDNANAGENKTITASGITLTGADAGNYTLSSTTATTTGTITKSQPTIAFVSGYNPGKTYDGQTIPNPTADDLTITGANFSDVTFIWSATPKDAGTYTLTASIPVTDNTKAASTTLPVTISPAALTVTPDSNQKKEYGAPDPALTYKITSGQLYGNDALTGALTYTGTDVGEYEITRGTLAATGNYTLTVASGVNFTITKLSLENAVVTLGAASFTYDGTVKLPAVTVTKSGSPVNAGEYDISYSNSNGGAGDHTHAGTVTVTVTAKSSGNYSGSNSTAVFTIAPKELTPAITGTTTKTYDGTTSAPAGLSITLDGKVGSDDVTATAASYAYDSPNVKDAKKITASGITLGGAAKDNYILKSNTAEVAGTIIKDTSATAPAAGEGYTLDYARETISITDGYEVSTANDGSGSAVPKGSVSAHLGKTLYIRKVEDDNHAASGWTAFTLAARPDAPSLTKTDETLKGQKNGSLSGTTTAMEYSVDGGKTWTACPGTALGDLSGGTTVQVRVKTTAAAPCGAASSHTIAEGKPITVAFDSKGGSTIEARPGLTYGAKVEKPADPTKEDYEFQGWYKETGCTTEWNFVSDTLTAENVTLYAKWKQVRFSVGGTVKANDGTTPISGAIVTLMRGSDQIDQGTTTDAGGFTFTKHVAAGAYNIVTTYTTEEKNQQIATTLITLSDRDMTEVEVKLPPEGANSQLTVSKNSDTPAVVVGGLDVEAAALKTGDVSTVTVSMEVEGKKETQVETHVVEAIKDEVKPESSTDAPVVEYLDITVTKQVDSGSKEVVEQTTQVIEIVVPFSFSGRTNVVVVRYHGTTAQKLTKADTRADGTYRTDEINGYIYIYTNRFSTYAVGYTAQYTITFNANGGTATETTSTTGSQGTLSSLPTNPSRDGYTFKGWYTAASGGTQVTTSTVFKADTTVYAQWQQNSSSGNTPTGGGGGGGGWSGVTTYAVTVSSPAHGKVTASPVNATSGGTVTLTVTPDSGYVLNVLTVTDSRGDQVKLTDKGNGKYTFTMPDRAVTVKAVFAPLPNGTQKPCDGGSDCPSRGFADLGSVGTWYHEAVDYALRNGLMGGYGDGLFGPDDTLSRAQLAQILHNKEGRPIVNYLLRFEDVPTGAWYTEAVRWAASAGIVDGYGNGRFGPGDNITREQLAVMLWRYAGSPAATDKELHFADAYRASDWALEALRWATEKSIINGKGNGILDPSGQATRAETAQMLYNFLR